MKRGLVLSLSALALVVCGSTAQAQSPTINVSLNLRYTDPGDPSEGGRWFLLANTTNPFGIAGLNVYLSNIYFADNPATAGVNEAPVFGNATAVGPYTTVTAADIGATVTTGGGTPFVSNTGGAGGLGGTTNLVYGQDLSGAIKTNIGKGAGTPGNIATDPLRNSTWNNSVLLMSGYFGGTRPSFVASGGNSTDGNVFSSATAGQPTPAAGVASPKVRGDSEVGEGLNTPANAGIFNGDVNRDGSVNANDFTILAANFGDPAPAGGFGWDQGDFNDDGLVNANDFTPLAANFGDPAPPAPTVGAVPEPAAFGLLALGSVGIMALRRRQG